MIEIFDRVYYKKYLNRIDESNLHNNFIIINALDILKQQLLSLERIFSNALFYGFGDPNFKEKAKNWTFANFIKDDKSQKIFEEFDMPLLDEKYDLIISNMTLHYVNDIPKALEHYHRILQKNGMFIAIFLGENTLKELRHATFELDNYLGKIFPKVAPMIEAKTIASLAQKAQFYMPISAIDSCELRFDSAKSLIFFLKKCGINNCLLNRPYYFYGKHYFKLLDEIYNYRFCVDGKVYASLDYVVFWASK